MKTKDFTYDLPEELIAQFPIKNRDESRLLVLDRESNEIEHRKFKDIIDYLEEGDTLVLNNTRVLPARIYGHRLGKNEKNEFLLIKEVKKDLWECLVRPGKKARPGHIIEYGNQVMTGEVMEITKEGTRLVKFDYEGDFEEKLKLVGEMPIPPYIHERLDEQERYQTVYSKHSGSAAAPTAGLHFTKDLMEKISLKGINIEYITLHVGLGTFSPVRVDNIKDHHMHSEFYNIEEDVAKRIMDTKKRGNKVISVGTTTTRTLESACDKNGILKAGSGWTDIFIYPGYEFKIVDNLITNFHLPESTLMMLVSAFANREQILDAYEKAVREKYRFFSFGDAMYIK